MDKPTKGGEGGRDEVGHWGWQIYTAVHKTQYKTSYRVDNWGRAVQLRELLTALSWPEREGNPEQRGYVGMWDWSTLLYARN